jgi:predicted permease
VSWFNRFSNLFRRENVDEELDEELQFHLDARTHDNLSAGMNAEAAQHDARRRFGNATLAKERAHEMNIVMSIETIGRDLRYALRSLRKYPGFTGLAVVALALGIGVNTAVFTIADWFLYRPLAVSDPGALTYLAVQIKGEQSWSNGLSYMDLTDIRAGASSIFDDVAGSFDSTDGLTFDGKTEPMAVDYVTGNFFETMGVKPALGRLLLRNEGGVPGEDPVLVLSNLFWKTRFHGDPNTIGKTALVNGHSVTIVGVAPEGFHGTDSWTDAQGYLPIGMGAIDSGSKSNLLTDGKARGLLLIARMKAGKHLSDTYPVLEVVSHRLSFQFPDSKRGISLRAFELRSSGPSGDPEGDPLRKVGALFLTLAALMLLLACGNVAGLLLIRGAERAREMAIRQALGARRARIVCQLLIENVLLALMGGAAGILLAWMATHALSTIHLAPSLPLVVDASVDWRLFAYVAGVGLLTSVLIGIVPALRTSRHGVMETIHKGGYAIAGAHQRLRNIVVISQVGISMVLLVVAGLFARSLTSIARVDLGFDPHNVLNLTMDPHLMGYSQTQGLTFYRELLDRARGLPTVEAASLAALVPMGNEVDGDDLDVPGYKTADRSKPHGRFNIVSADYFRTMLTPLIRGRDFAATDNEEAPFVAIVNQAMAEKLWPNDNAVGKMFALENDPKHPIQVVGVAKNSRNYDFSGPVGSYFYLPLAQHYRPTETLQIRTKVLPERVTRDAVSLIHSLVPEMPTFDVQPMTAALDHVNGMLLPQLGSILTACFGILGITLAVVGLYGVASYNASQRTREIGLRMALGAHRGAIMRLVFRHGLFLVLVGVGIGVLSALGVSRLVGDFLVGVQPSDPVTYVGVTIVLLLAALSASYFPARRATRVDPMAALRDE